MGVRLSHDGAISIVCARFVAGRAPGWPRFRRRVNSASRPHMWCGSCLHATGRATRLPIDPRSSRCKSIHGPTHRGCIVLSPFVYVVTQKRFSIWTSRRDPFDNTSTGYDLAESVVGIDRSWNCGEAEEQA